MCWSFWKTCDYSNHNFMWDTDLNKWSIWFEIKVFNAKLRSNKVYKGSGQKYINALSRKRAGYSSWIVFLFKCECLFCLCSNMFSLLRHGLVCDCGITWLNSLIIRRNVSVLSQLNNCVYVNWKVSKYHQEIPQSHTAYKPMALWKISFKYV